MHLLSELLVHTYIHTHTDYGRPMKNPKLLGLDRQFGQISFGAFGGIFSRFMSTHFDTVSPLSRFFINQPLFLQKNKPSYQNPKYLFGIGISIWIWAGKNKGFIHWVSVVCKHTYGPSSEVKKGQARHGEKILIKVRFHMEPKMAWLD